MFRKMSFVLCAIVVVSLGMTTQPVSAEITDITMALNPVGYWKFEDNLDDSSGNGNSLTVVDDAAFAKGRGDFSLADGGGSFYVDTPAGNVLNLVGNTLSINAWVNFGDTPADQPWRTRVLVNKQRSDPWSVSAWDYGLWTEIILGPDFPNTLPEAFRLNTYLGDGWGAGAIGDLTPDDLAVDTWHMVTVSMDAGIASYYYDGELVGIGEVGGAATGGSPAFSRLVIGNSGSGLDYFKGMIDEVSIFGTAISADDVASLYTWIPRLMGDADENGVVDEVDAATLAANWLGSDKNWGDGDFNADGVVNDIDATILATNWHGSGLASQSVPEPSILALLLTGCSVLIIRRRCN